MPVVITLTMFIAVVAKQRSICLSVYPIFFSYVNAVRGQRAFLPFSPKADTIDVYRTEIIITVTQWQSSATALPDALLPVF